MPQTSNTEEVGPSSGSVCSLITELIKALSPILRGVGTDDVVELKKYRKMTAVKIALERLLHRRTVVEDYGGVQLAAITPKQSHLAFPACFPEDTAFFVEVTSFHTRNQDLQLQVVVHVKVLGNRHLHTIVFQKPISVPAEHIFVSLQSLASALKFETRIHPQILRASAQYVARNFSLLMRAEDGGKYWFQLDALMDSDATSHQTPNENETYHALASDFV